MARQRPDSFVRRPLFIGAAALAVLAVSGVAGFRNLTEPHYAQVLEVREVTTPRQCPTAPQAAPADGAPPAECASTSAPLETAYDVRYRLGAREDVIRLPYDPGRQIAVEDGHLILEPPAR